MNRARLEKQLKIDEGKLLRVYQDSEGFLTAGIGHRIVESDHFHLGDPISEQQCRKWFLHDVDRALIDCNQMFENWMNLPHSVQEILANMMFNLGLKSFMGFVRLHQAINSKNWKEAAQEMQNSLWAKQVGERAVRLIARMEKIK